MVECFSTAQHLDLLILLSIIISTSIHLPISIRTVLLHILLIHFRYMSQLEAFRYHHNYLSMISDVMSMSFQLSLIMLICSTEVYYVEMMTRVTVFIIHMCVPKILCKLQLIYMGLCYFLHLNGLISKRTGPCTKWRYIIQGLSTSICMERRQDPSNDIFILSHLYIPKYNPSSIYA